MKRLLPVPGLVSLFFVLPLLSMPVQPVRQAGNAMIDCLALDSRGTGLAICENFPFEGKSSLSVYDASSKRTTLSVPWKEMLHGAAFLRGDSHIILCVGLDLVTIDAKTGRILGRLSTGYEQITSWHFDAKNSIAYVGGMLKGQQAPGAVSLFDVSVALKRKRTLALTEPVVHIDVSAKGAVFTGESKLFFITSAESSVREWRLDGEHVPHLTSASFLSEDGDRLAAGLEGGGALVLEFPLMKILVPLGGPSPHSFMDRTRFVLAATGTRLILLGSDRGEAVPPSGTMYERSCLRIIDRETKKEVDHVDFEGTMKAVVASPAGPVYLGFSNGTIRRLW